MQTTSETTDTREQYHALIMQPELVNLRNDIRDTFRQLCEITDMTLQGKTPPTDAIPVHAEIAATYRHLLNTYAERFHLAMARLEYPTSPTFSPERRKRDEILIF